MGKVASRFWSKGYMGGFGVPQVHPELEHLIGWQRERLDHAFRTYCTRPTLGVDFESFAEILEFENHEDELPAFERLHPKKGKVEMLSIFAAMVATSNQRFISRISFLFSIFDLDGNGSINGAEFYIAVSGVVKGISMFYESASVPSKRELEGVVSDVFCRIDTDESGYITLGELLCYAYRSQEVRTLFQPFPSTDQRIFEDILAFPRQEERVMATLLDRVCAVEEKLSLSPESQEISPSARGRRTSISFREGPAKKAPSFSRAHTWFLYEVFLQIAGGRLQNTIPVENFQSVLADTREIDKVLEQVSKAAGVIVAPRERVQQVPSPRSAQRKNSKRLSVVAQTHEGISSLVQHLRRFFSSGGASAKMDAALAEGNVSLRAFFCVLVPHLPEQDIEMCLRWCGSFRARDVLTTFLDSGDIKTGLGMNDVQAIFKALDVDGNGTLSVEELMQGGTLTEEQACSVLTRLDTDHNGALSADELQGILFSMDTTLRTDLRNVFALQSGHLGTTPLSDD